MTENTQKPTFWSRFKSRTWNLLGMISAPNIFRWMDPGSLFGDANYKGVKFTESRSPSYGSCEDDLKKVGADMYKVIGDFETVLAREMAKVEQASGEKAAQGSATDESRSTDPTSV